MVVIRQLFDIKYLTINTIAIKIAKPKKILVGSDFILYYLRL